MMGSILNNHKSKGIKYNSSPRLPLPGVLDNVDELGDGLDRLVPLAFLLIVPAISFQGDGNLLSLKLHHFDFS